MLSRKLTMVLALAVILMFGLAVVVPAQALQVDAEDDPNPGTGDEGVVGEDDQDDEEELDLGADKTAYFECLVEAYPELEITVEQLQLLFDEGWGLGELAIAVVVSADSGKSLEDVLALASDGMGWGEVAKESGIEARNLGQVISAAMGKKGLLWKGHEQDIDDAMQKNRGNGNAYGHDPQHRGGKPDTTGKGNNGNKGKK